VIFPCVPSESVLIEKIVMIGGKFVVLAQKSPLAKTVLRRRTWVVAWYNKA
jgi:hypothetical protein